MERIKRCINCGRFLGENSFGMQVEKRLPSGKRRRSVCKKCVRVMNYIYYKTNKHVEEFAQKYRDNSAKYYQKNKEKVLKYRKAWKEANKDHVKKQNKEWYKRDYKNNRDKYLYKVHIRRTRSSEHELSQAEIEDIKTLFKWARELPGNWDVDHIVPISKGGRHHPDNLQLIPASQNRSKHDKCPKEFYGRWYEFCTNPAQQKFSLVNKSAGPVARLGPKFFKKN